MSADPTVIGQKVTSSISAYTDLATQILGAIGPAASAIKDALGPLFTSLKGDYEALIDSLKQHDLLDAATHAKLLADLDAKYSELESL